ncbi:MAG: hypothetical protein ACOCT9_02635, partial [archaeon]
MSQKQTNNIDPLTEKLLKKCEVSSLAEFYEKWVEQYDHIVKISRICETHTSFTKEKVKNDLLAISHFCVIHIINFAQKLQDNGAFKKKYYLIDAKGLA